MGHTHERHTKLVQQAEEYFMGLGFRPHSRVIRRYPEQLQVRADLVMGRDSMVGMKGKKIWVECGVVNIDGEVLKRILQDYEFYWWPYYWDEPLRVSKVSLKEFD